MLSKPLFVIERHLPSSRINAKFQLGMFKGRCGVEQYFGGVSDGIKIERLPTFGVIEREMSERFAKPKF